MNRTALAAAMAIFASTAAAQTITFQADSDVRYVRAYTDDLMDLSVVEFVAPRNGPMNCIVIDARNDILASGVAYAQVGQFFVQRFDTSRAANVLCRYTR